MYYLKVKSSFSAAHFLRNYEGKCENVHGHNWEVELKIKGEKLNDTGLLIDFRELKQELNAVLETLDHKLINDTNTFSNINPSCENLSKHIFELLEEKLKNKKNIKAASVSVWETANSSAEYVK
ncbi:6-carboxytetrahydropterin synthase QueD [bacterium]